MGVGAELWVQMGPNKDPHACTQARTDSVYIGGAGHGAIRSFFHRQ